MMRGVVVGRDTRMLFAAFFGVGLVRGFCCKISHVLSTFRLRLCVVTGSSCTWKTIEWSCLYFVIAQCQRSGDQARLCSPAAVLSLYRLRRNRKVSS